MAQVKGIPFGPVIADVVLEEFITKDNKAGAKLVLSYWGGTSVIRIDPEDTPMYRGQVGEDVTVSGVMGITEDRFGTKVDFKKIEIKRNSQK